MNIIIYTTPETLLHKQNKSQHEVYWSLPNRPKQRIKKIYFAIKGFIRGYFKISWIEEGGGCEIYWHPETWTEIKPMPCKPFRGFKYFKGKK